MDLQDAIFPVDEDEFLSEYWIKRALYVPGEPGKFATLFGWKDLNEILNGGGMQPPTLKLVRNGKPADAGEYTSPATLGTGESVTDPAKVLRLCQSGATMILNGVHRDWPSLRALSDEIATRLGEHVQINAYCSWAEAQGFALHFDTHEVLVLQVEGRKRWRVFAPTVENAVTFQATLPKPGDPPYLEPVLSRGDVLYIPRGHWHDAVADAEPSLHLTVGIPCRTGLAFQRWLADQVCSDAAWGANLPLSFGADGAWQHPSSPLYLHLRDLVGRMRDALQDPGLVGRYVEDVVRRGLPRRPYQLPYQVALGTAVDLDTVFTRPAGQQWLIKPEAGGTGVQITVWGRRMRFKGRASELAQEIFRRQAFTPADLMRACPDAEWAEVKRLVTEMLRAGVLFLEARESVGV